MATGSLTARASTRGSSNEKRREHPPRSGGPERPWGQLRSPTRHPSSPTLRQGLGLSSSREEVSASGTSPSQPRASQRRPREGPRGMMRWHGARCRACPWNPAYTEEEATALGTSLLGCGCGRGHHHGPVPTASGGAHGGQGQCLVGHREARAHASTGQGPGDLGP